MKNRTLKQIISLLATISLFSITTLLPVSCDEVPQGSHETENAVYTPDSIVIKAILDTIIDARIIKFEIPWQSNAIEGVLGTFPMTYKIIDIHSDTDFDLQYALDLLYVRNNGVIIIPTNHKFPVGKYNMTIAVTNVTGTTILSDIFSIIVK